MLAHNAHVVYCSKYLTAKVMLMPITLHYFWLCLAHDCNVNAHAKNIPTLLMNVLCPILCKRKLLTQRLKAKFLVPPQLGGTSGVSECTHVLYVHCTFILWSARALTNLYRQYRRRQNHCQKLASWPIRSLKKFYNLTPEGSKQPQTPPLYKDVSKVSGN